MMGLSGSHVFVAQWRERQVPNLEVAGSTPAGDTYTTEETVAWRYASVCHAGPEAGSVRAGTWWWSTCPRSSGDRAAEF